MSADRLLPAGGESVRLALAGDRIAGLHVVVSEHLDAIAKLYKPDAGVKLTLVARVPDHPDGSRDCVVTNDDLVRVIAAIRLKLSSETPVSIGAGRLNGLPVSPEAARLIVHAVLFATAYSTGDAAHAAIARGRLDRAMEDVDPLGPWDGLFAELRRIGGA